MYRLRFSFFGCTEKAELDGNSFDRKVVLTAVLLIGSEEFCSFLLTLYLLCTPIDFSSSLD